MVSSLSSSLIYASTVFHWWHFERYEKNVYTTPNISRSYFKSCAIENAEYREKKSSIVCAQKNSSYSCKRTSIINVSQFLNPWLWKNTWGIFIETKSSNKTDPTLLTCASSFSSSTCTIVTVHNVDVNTSCMRAQRHFSCFPFPCNAASRSTHTW